MHAMASFGTTQVTVTGAAAARDLFQYSSLTFTSNELLSPNMSSSSCYRKYRRRPLCLRLFAALNYRGKNKRSDKTQCACHVYTYYILTKYTHGTLTIASAHFCALFMFTQPRLKLLRKPFGRVCFSRGARVRHHYWHLFEEATGACE